MTTEEITKNGRIYSGDNGRKMGTLTTLMQEGIAAVGRKWAGAVQRLQDILIWMEHPKLSSTPLWGLGGWG